MQYSIKEFSTKLGGRYKKDGPFSGEEFRQEKLIPLYEQLSEGDILEINLDGTKGYPPSFLEEAFGGFARIYGVDTALKTFKFISLEETYLIDEIKADIKKALDK